MRISIVNETLQKKSLLLNENKAQSIACDHIGVNKVLSIRIYFNLLRIDW